MSNPIPSQIALAQITNGTLADGSVVQSNDSAIQAAVNALIVALSGGSNGQFLKAVDGSDVVYEAAASLTNTGLQTFSGPTQAAMLGFTWGAALTAAAGVITITNNAHLIGTSDGTAISTINGRTGNPLLLLENNLGGGATANFATGGNVFTGFSIPSSGLALLLYVPALSKWVCLAVVSGTGVNRTSKNVLTYGAPVTPDASLGGLQTVTITNATAFTVAAPLNPPAAGETGSFYLELFNNSGGAHGTITFNAVYINPGSPVIANGKKKLLGFTWNGASWVLSGGSTADY